MDEERLRASLEDLSGRDHDSARDAAGALHEVVVAAGEVLNVSGCALMLVDRSHDLRCVVATTDLARRFEHAQAAAGVGPCLDCFALDRVLESSDLHNDERWPDLAAGLDGRVRALMAVPVHVGRTPVGSFNAFSDAHVGWGDQHARALVAYAGVLEGALHLAVSDRGRSEIGAHLDDALENRAATERAVGFLMAREQLDAVRALHALRQAARRRGEAIGAVSARLLEDGRLPD